MAVGLGLLLVVSLLPQSATSPFPGEDRAALRQKGQSALAAQRWSEAEEVFRSLTESDGNDSQAWLHLGYALHAQGKLDAALPVHVKAAEFRATKATASYNAACVYALKGDVDHAIEWLQKAVKAGFSDAGTMQSDKDLASLRGDARYPKLMDDVRARQANGVPQPFVGTTPRASTRLAYFSQKGTAQAMIDYGQPPWKPEYAQAISSGKLTGKRWRMGQDFWSHLDTFTDLTLGGTAVKAGYYYLVIEQRAADQFVLTLLDPNVVRQQRVDAFTAAKYQGPGIDVPLAHELLSQPATKLEIDWIPSEDDGSKGTLNIHFGPHALSAPFTCQLAAAPATRTE